MTGDWLEGALRRCAAWDAVQVMEGGTFGVAAEAVTAASIRPAWRLNKDNKDDVRGDFITAGFPKGYATKKPEDGLRPAHRSRFRVKAWAGTAGGKFASHLRQALKRNCLRKAVPESISCQYAPLEILEALAASGVGFPAGRTGWKLAFPF